MQIIEAKNAEQAQEIAEMHYIGWVKLLGVSKLINKLKRRITALSEQTQQKIADISATRGKEIKQMNKIKVEPTYKIVKKATMPCGTLIQIEDWHPCYDFEPTCGILAAYPIAKETNTESIMNYPERGKTFRLELGFKTEEQTRQAFADLLSGKNRNGNNLQIYATITRPYPHITKLETG